MNSIGVDAFSEIGADGAGSGLLRIRGAHEFAILEDGVFAFENLNHDGAGGHKLDQIGKEGTFAMDGIEAFGFSLAQLAHLGGDDLETVRFKAGIDLADDVLGDGVRLDDGESALNSHFLLLSFRNGKIYETP